MGIIYEKHGKEKIMMKINSILINKILLMCAGASIVLALIFTLGFSEEKGKNGLVTYVEGSAKKQKLVEADWKTVYKDTTVIGGERVRTLSESRAEIKLAGLDQIRMAPKTTIDILKLYEETKEKVRESNIVLQQGDLWANVAKKSENTTFSIGTPVAAAAITGTTLRMSVNSDSSSELKVYNGEVALSNLPSTAKTSQKSLQPYQIQGPQQIPGPREVSVEEWTIIVKSMQKVKLDNKGKVLYSGKFSNTDEDENSDWVLWNKARDTSAGK
jgi:hypothetical protein